jgi:transposase-like protein
MAMMMYPVAIGFIDGETTDNWVWFMRQLHKAIGNQDVLAVSTDACKGLENAVKEVFPQAEQRECFRHLMNNFVKRFGGDIFSKMYPTARAYRKEVSQYFFNQVVEASPDAKDWLDKNHKLLWRRSEFNPEIKCDYITNNLAEVFNNWIKVEVVENPKKMQRWLL